MGSVRFTDFHSTWLDWIARFGVIGMVVLIPLVRWVWIRTFSKTAPWKVWSFILAVFAGTFQSAESLAVLSLLGMFWFMRLNKEEEVDHFYSLQGA